MSATSPSAATSPFPAPQRGFYFAGAQYLTLPAYGLNDESPLRLTNSLTISTWIKPEGATDSVIYCSANLALELAGG
ncbi:MAG: hypothetical protein J0651_04845, partial [Actinobacteria bacterium]|nr:hypothetical protein [Actinomycetota bacterium]